MLTDISYKESGGSVSLRGLPQAGRSLHGWETRHSKGFNMSSPCGGETFVGGQAALLLKCDSNWDRHKSCRTLMFCKQKMVDIWILAPYHWEIIINSLQSYFFSSVVTVRWSSCSWMFVFVSFLACCHTMCMQITQSIQLLRVQWQGFWKYLHKDFLMMLKWCSFNVNTLKHFTLRKIQTCWKLPYSFTDDELVKISLIEK